MVLVGEWLLRRRVDQRAARLLGDRAVAHALRLRRERRLQRAERVVERVRRVGIFGDLDVAAGGLEARSVRLARRDRIVVVLGAAEDADRLVAGVGVAGEGRRAVRIERYIGGEREAGLVQNLVE